MSIKSVDITLSPTFRRETVGPEVLFNIRVNGVATLFLYTVNVNVFKILITPINVIDIANITAFNEKVYGIIDRLATGMIDGNR